MSGSRRAQVSLPAEDEILITRVFDAPRELVWRAYTTPELVRRWWTARRGEMVVCEIDLRVGGGWRYVLRTPSGDEAAFHGEYLEVAAPERLASTEVYEAMPDAPARDTLTLVERDGRTELQLLVRHSSRANRDAHLQSGMEDGLQDAFELLEEVALSAARP